MDFSLPVNLTELFVHTEPFKISIFFRTAFLRKLFDIRFPYKHCNFYPDCLLVKMPSKTVTRSIDTFRLRCSSIFICVSHNILGLFNIYWIIFFSKTDKSQSTYISIENIEESNYFLGDNESKKKIATISMEPVHLASVASAARNRRKRGTVIMCWPLFVCLARSLSKIQKTKNK